MWCLVYLETAIPSSVLRLLKTNGFKVHVAADVDDLLDQLWYHGSNVACIIIEAQHLPGFDDFVEAILDWPDLPVLVYGCIAQCVDPTIHNIHCSEFYSIDRVTQDVCVFDHRHPVTN